MVNAFAEATRAGRGILNLENKSNDPVTVKTIRVHRFNVLQRIGEFRLEGKGTKALDITRTPLKLFGNDRVSLQSKQVRISLRLDPEPTDQPGPGDYEVEIEDGRIAQFHGI